MVAMFGCLVVNDGIIAEIQEQYEAAAKAFETVAKSFHAQNIDNRECID